MSRRAVVASLLLCAGVILIFAVPTPAEGPMLLFLTDEHAIRLVDALGLALAVPSWFYLNILAIRFLVRLKKSKR